MCSLFADLVKTLGYVNAQRVVDAYGGRRLYVPRADRITPDHDLSIRLGWDLAQRVALAYNGQGFDVPLNTAETRRWRNEQIMKDHRAGVPHHRIAAQYRLTERSVFRIVAGMQEGTV